MSNKTKKNEKKKEKKEKKKKKKKEKKEKKRELENQRGFFFFRLNRRKRDVYLCLIFAIDLPKD